MTTDPHGLGPEWKCDEGSSLAETWKHQSGATIAKIASTSPWTAWNRYDYMVELSCDGPREASTLALGNTRNYGAEYASAMEHMEKHERDGQRLNVFSALGYLVILALIVWVNQ